MKAKDIFGLVLRCVALWVMLWGSWQLLGAVAVLANPNGFITPLGYFLYGAPAFFTGILILLFADALVGLTYRNSSE